MDTYNILPLNDLCHLLGRDKVAMISDMIHFNHWRLGCLKQRDDIGTAFKKKKAFLLAFEIFLEESFSDFCAYKYDYLQVRLYVCD